MAGIPLLGYLFTVTTYKFDIKVSTLITNILLKLRVQFVEIGCHGIRRRKKKKSVGRCCKVLKN
jgi:hypothetical protein